YNHDLLCLMCKFVSKYLFLIMYTKILYDFALQKTLRPD
ncbi:AAA family ATPase, partial [Klebsiella pneumoniae]|nr:AAA family ATPase [Klebsiella pneumoniae]